jgi:O-antigen ligase
LIGERSNFIKTTIIITLFIFFIYDIKLKFKLLSIPIIFLIFFSVLSLNENYKLRYFIQISKIHNKNIYGISSYLENSTYGAHYKVAEEIFKDNPFFGVGIKNFRVESYSDKYHNLDHKFNDRRGNTHPHQLHYELLAETGLFGYLSFMIFILISFYLFFKSYKKNKNIYQFSGMLFVLINLAPLLPSGSFFSTYGAGLFWINYSIMIGYLSKDTKF